MFRVAVDTPLRRLFDYLPPDLPQDAAELRPGMRVRVPFGRRRLVGVVMAVADSSDLPPERLKPILEVLDEAPALESSALGLIEWAAEYYHHPVGQVLATALPKLMRLGAGVEATEERWTMSDSGRDAAAAGEPRRAPKQRALLEFLLSRGGAAPPEVLAEHSPGWREAARALEKRGWLERAEVARVEVPRPARVRAGAPLLLPEQHDAVERVAAASGTFAAFLLQGVTGSGKTEVYLRLTEETLVRGRTALVLVPEIGLTPQLVGRFRERFEAPLAVLHSALTDTERLAAWRAAWSGQARIVLGTRSAVFAPLADLGLIVVDEEHDASFKQHEGDLRYSARDLAVVRAQLAGVPVLLGSATPSLETLHNVAAGRYTRMRLLRRPGESKPPIL